MPSQFAGVSYLLLLLILLSGCGSFTVPFWKNKKTGLLSGDYQDMSSRDYADHLASLKNPFLATPGVKTLRTDGVINKYFSDLATELISNNEIFFSDLKTASVIILDTDSPLHFSLPKGEIFISRGLLTKYIKHESMLVGIVAYELVRSEKLLYPKSTIIPVGFVPLERMLTFGRLPIDSKMEVHKWAHHITVRSGYDGEYYLSWLQIQNRNTADFILQVGDANMIDREESMFKAFLIKNAIEDVSTKKNSSKNFYTVINRIRDGVL